MMETQLHNKTQKKIEAAAKPGISVEEAVERALAVRHCVDNNENGILHAAAHVLKYYTKSPSSQRIDLERAEEIMRRYLTHLLDSEQPEAAATIMWGRDVFDWRPESTRQVWQDLRNHDKELVIGAGSMSKSYGGGAWFYLDWWRDPEYTLIKVVSLTMEHAETNIFAHIQTFNRNALVRPKGWRPLAESIMVNNDRKQGIQLIAIPKGEDGTGVLRGFHPVPRPGKAHKIFGRLTRVRVLLDEAEKIPPGCWKGVDNICLTIDSKDPGRVKVMGATNPDDRETDFGKRVEPKNGWNSINIDDSIDWISGQGWHIRRLDAARCENVIEKRVVFPGLQTYEGYMSFVAKGETSDYYTMARGWYPEDGVANVIIPPTIVDGAIGVLRFIGPTIPLAGFDLALEGVDQVMAATGRIGLCDGWTPRDGRFIPFGTPNDPKTRECLQLDAMVPFPKKKTIEQAQAIVKFCRTMGIGGTWLCVDRTGNGSGIHDSLQTLFSPDVLGINYSQAASDKKVMDDDSKVANELYSGVVSELIYALRKFLEFGVVKISPTFRNEALVKQMTNRRGRSDGLLQRVESKKDYCKRTQERSPDEMDAFSLLVHLARMRHRFGAMMVDVPIRATSERHEKTGLENMEFVDFSE
tara:strand:- start:5963 stop:7876 length:1914 start_codon:yes stop_codon:yes gene_type:complete